MSWWPQGRFFLPVLVLVTLGQWGAVLGWDAEWGVEGLRAGLGWPFLTPSGSSLMDGNSSRAAQSAV